MEEGVYSMDIISSGQTGPSVETAKSPESNVQCNDDSFRIMQNGPCNEQSRLAVLNIRENDKSEEPDLEPFGIRLSRPCYLADTRNEELASSDKKYRLEYVRRGTVHSEGKRTITYNATTGTPTTCKGLTCVVGVMGVGNNDKEGEGEAFDGNVANKQVPLGFVNQINFTNCGFHPHHQHVNPFQFISLSERVGPINGLFGTRNDTEFREFNPDRWYMEGDWGDVFQYVAGGPYAILRYPSNQFTGVMIYHCHILIHEDRGMMGWFNLTENEDPNITEWEGAWSVDKTCSRPDIPLSSYSRPDPRTIPPTVLCKDDSNFEFIHTNKKGRQINKGNCNFVAKKSRNRCKKTMPNGKKAKVSCRKTCGYRCKD